MLPSFPSNRRGPHRASFGNNQVRYLGYDETRRTQDAGLVERVVKMVERVSVRRERGGAMCPPILVE